MYTLNFTRIKPVKFSYIILFVVLIIYKLGRSNLFICPLLFDVQICFCI